MNLMLLYGYRSVDLTDRDRRGRSRRGAGRVQSISDGAGSSRIAAGARDQYTAAPRGTWTGNHAVEMLTNEKYTGDALLQKTFVGRSSDQETAAIRVSWINIMPKTRTPPIIDRETFERAQAILAQRREMINIRKPTTVRYPLTGVVAAGTAARITPQDALHGAHPSRANMAVRDLFKQGKALLPREPDPGGGDAHRPDLRGAGRGKSQ